MPTFKSYQTYPCRLALLTVWATALGAFGGASSTRAAEAPVQGRDWPQWRGPHFDGSADAANLPESFSKTENVLWTTHLPGGGNGTPVSFGDRVFVSALDGQSKKLYGVCLDGKDGHVVWQKEIGIGFKEKGRNTMATPSPVTDGKRVIFYFGTGDLAAFDFEGKPLWSRNIQKDHGPFNFMWLYGSSPLLYKGKLYVQCLHRDRPYDRGESQSAPADSYLLAIDPETGKDLWKQTRPSDANDESKEAYTTPIPFESSGGLQIVLVGGDCVTGHDPETGKELWRFGGLNPGKKGDRRMVPSVACGEGVVVACVPKHGPVYAIKQGASGDVSANGAAWKAEQFTSDVCVPLFYQHQLYVLDGDKKTLYCVDPKSGEVKWNGALGGGAVFRASPTAADGKIYCVNENGDVWVLAAGEFKVLSKTSLGGTSRASIVLTDGRVLVRAGEELFAFGKK